METKEFIDNAWEFITKSLTYNMNVDYERIENLLILHAFYSMSNWRNLPEEQVDALNELIACITKTISIPTCSITENSEVLLLEDKTPSTNGRCFKKE